jgi:hypothetical protein
MVTMASIPDEITLYPSTSSDRVSSKPLLVYFITGNPGLIGYYQDFVKQVQHNLSKTPIPQEPNLYQDSNIIFHGSSLDGFQVSSPSDPDLNFPLSLPEQISQVKKNIGRKVAELSSIQQGIVEDDEPMPVVLMGHSVGAYILMEVIAQWQAEQQEGKRKHSLWRPVAGINLFPTVTEIAKSEKGRQLSVCVASCLWVCAAGDS